MENGLVVAPCSYEAVKFACKNLHYAKSVPAGKLVKHGVWEDSRFIGVIVYGDSPNINMAVPYGLDYTEVCELRRIALTTHKHPITQILKKSLKLLREKNPNLQLVISYADSNYNHLGIIYQAGSWIYEGTIPARTIYIINGKEVHGKTVSDK